MWGGTLKGVVRFIFSKIAWLTDIWDKIGAGGYWNSCFSRHLIDWELGAAETFLLRL